MKKLFTGLCAAICAGVITAVAITAATGCKSVPSTGTMYNVTYAVGLAAGIIANEKDIDVASRKAVGEILDVAKTWTPATNETFYAAWMEPANDYVWKLIEAERLDDTQGAGVVKAFSYVCKGLDFVFEKRYPSAKQYKEVVSAAIDGLIDGFVTVFKTDDTEALAVSPRVLRDYDVEAYNWLKATAK